MKSTIYLDYNATTPIAPEVADIMKTSIAKYYGNPSSSHIMGKTSRHLIDNARYEVAKMINAEPEEIIFTGSGSEANNLAIKGIQEHYNIAKIITSPTEHPSVIETCQYLQKKAETVFLPVDNYGMIKEEDVENLTDKNPVLLSVMHSNNETGLIQNIAGFSGIVKVKNVYFHSDAAQSAGKVAIDVKALGVDLLTIVGHKFYAPKGIAVLYVKKGTKLAKQVHGANQENNHRAGTENLTHIIAIGKAAELVRINLETYRNNMLKAKNTILDTFAASKVDYILNSHPENCLPNTINISFRDVEAVRIINQLTNVAVSAGAACHSDFVAVSPVLDALKIGKSYVMGTLRISTGRDTSEDEAEIAAKAILKIVRKQQCVH